MPEKKIEAANKKAYSAEDLKEFLGREVIMHLRTERDSLGGKIYVVKGAVLDCEESLMRLSNTIVLEERCLRSNSGRLLLGVTLRSPTKVPYTDIIPGSLALAKDAAN